VTGRGRRPREELFDPALREALVPFFRKALRRDARERHDNAEDMLRDWRDCFAAIEAADAAAEADEAELRERLEGANCDSSVHELGLGTRATNSLDWANVLTVEDLLTVPMRRLLRLRGVGNKTRREIAAAVKLLRDNLGNPPDAGRAAAPEEPDEQPAGRPVAAERRSARSAFDPHQPPRRRQRPPDHHGSPVSRADLARRSGRPPGR
jgi:hypothetical protein